MRHTGKIDYLLRTIGVGTAQNPSPHRIVGSARRLAVLTTLLAAGCVSTPPPPPFGADASVVGVRITTVAPIGIFSSDVAEAFFVRVDSGAPTQQVSIIPSNYHDGDYVYLLNAKAGEYAVVAARRKGQYGETFTTYLPQEVIEQSLVTVGAADVAFMGEFEVKSSMKMGEMDAAQRHYVGVIQPGDRGGFSLFSTNYVYRGVLKNADRSQVAEGHFLSQAQDELAEHGWADVLRANGSNLEIAEP